MISFPAGRVLWHYGHANVRSGAPGYLNTPDDAYLLPNGLVSVADAYNCRVLFIAPAHRSSADRDDGCLPRTTRPHHSAR